MNVYLIHFHDKNTATVRAFSYTDDEEKYYFHKKEDQSDKDSWFWMSDVRGIDNQGRPPGPMIA